MPREEHQLAAVTEVPALERDPARRREDAPDPAVLDPWAEPAREQKQREVTAEHGGDHDDECEDPTKLAARDERTSGEQREILG